MTPFRSDYILNGVWGIVGGTRTRGPLPCALVQQALYILKVKGLIFVHAILMPFWIPNEAPFTQMCLQKGLC